MTIDAAIIELIKKKLLNYIDPYYNIQPIDKENIIEINNYLITYKINTSLHDSYISQLDFSAVKQIVLSMLNHINTCHKFNNKNYDFKDLLVTKFFYKDHLYSEQVKFFINNKFCKLFDLLASDCAGALVRFIIDKILDGSELSIIKALDMMTEVLNKNSSNNVDFIIRELKDCFDIYQNKFVINSKRHLFVAMNLPVDCDERIYDFIQTIIYIYLVKIKHYISYDQHQYNNLYLNFEISKSKTVNKILESSDNNEELIQNQLLLTKIQLLQAELIDVLLFKEILDLLKRPQIIINLNIRHQSKNLLELASLIKHIIKQDIISAIFNKIISQNIKAEETNLYNKYFCFNWTIQQADFDNFKKILPNCQNFELNNAEGKVLFEHIEQYEENTRYRFISFLVYEILNSEKKYYLSLEQLLQQCCIYSYVDLVSQLLQNGAKVNSAVNGIFPVHIAAKTGNLEVIQQLIKYKVNINIHDQDGHTAIYLAAAHGHTSISDYLLNR